MMIQENPMLGRQISPLRTHEVTRVHKQQRPQAHSHIKHGDIGVPGEIIIVQVHML